MKTKSTLIASTLVLLLLTSSFFFVQAQPTQAVIEPKVIITDASNSPNSKYQVTVNTTDGGWADFLFVWQIRNNWGGRQVIFNTAPMLQMAKYFENGTLDYSITYIPLYLVQYKDADDNGLFDVWTSNELTYSEEIEDELIDWSNQNDRSCKIYPLNPTFTFNEKEYWGWNVSPLSQENITVNETLVPTFSWSLSAIVPSTIWGHASSRESGKINVYFAYNIRLLPENPEVKYDFKFDGITWINDNNSTKLAMLSAVLYHSKDPCIVHVGNKRCSDFSETTQIPLLARRFTIASDVSENIQSFTSYNPNATIDGLETQNSVTTAIHPLFLLPIQYMGIGQLPAGVYIKGTTPGFNERKTWKHYLAFSHQLSLPHFNEEVGQDPVISLTAQLSTISLPPFSGKLLPIEALTILTAISTISVVVYILLKRH